MNGSRLSARIQGIGLLAPGLPNWATGTQVLAGKQVYIPAATVLSTPQALPAAERRRASRITKTALAVGFEAVMQASADAKSLATVFSASAADGHNCHAICETLASNDRQVSPTRFHNSVHNAVAGYWSIAAAATAPSQVLCACDASFAAGLLEALVQVAVNRQPVLLVVYDAEYPMPIHHARPIIDAAGIALLLAPTDAPDASNSLAQISISLHATDAATSPISCMTNPSLEHLRLGNPAMRGLPLLAQLAQQSSGHNSVRLRLEYLDHTAFYVDIQ